MLLKILILSIIIVAIIVGAFTLIYYNKKRAPSCGYYNNYNTQGYCEVCDVDDTANCEVQENKKETNQKVE